MEKPSQIAKRVRIANQQAIIETVSSVDATVIQRRIDEGRQLRQIAIAADSELAALAQQYCMKTGKPLGKLPIAAIEQTIAIHGRERGQWLLEIQQSNSVAPEWLATDPESLTKLSKADPCGWFIWAASHCWQRGNRATPATPHNGMDGHDATPNMGELANAANPQPANETLSIRLANSRQRQTAYRQLQANCEQSPDDFLPLLVETNEVMRRVFALVNPMQFATLRHHPIGTLVSATANRNALREFREWLGTVLAVVTKSITRRHLQQCDPLYIRHSEICEIMQKHRGLSQFRMQERLDTRNSADPEIMLALRDFMVDELTKSRKSPRLDPAKVTLVQPRPVVPAIQSASQIKLPTPSKPKRSLAELLKGGK